VIRLISGYHKVRKGDAAEGYHQSLIDITPQRVQEELNALLQEKPIKRKRSGCGY
jgi:heptosyltransferase-2